MEKNEQQVPWTYNGEVVIAEYIPPDVVGFVYRIMEYATEGYAQAGDWRYGSRVYIGKKLLNSTTRKRISLREKEKTKTRKTFKVTVKSTWEKYNSSCKPLQEKMKEHPELFTKEILRFCWSKRNLSWTELEEQIKHDVLRKPSWNECIAGHYWKRDVIKPTEP